MIIHNEADLRKWIKIMSGEYNLLYPDRKLTLEWIEPKFGSSIGLPDINMQLKGYQKVGVELKHLSFTKKGLKWTLRPVQRRYHVMGSKSGKRSCVFASTTADDLLLIRGDKIPLRDYSSHPDSGCPGGLAPSLKIGDFTELVDTISSDFYWL